MTISEIFQYEFLTRALLAGIFVAISAGLIGVPLVLKKQALLGDGLSHVAFAAFAVALVAGLSPTEFAVPIVILASILLLILQKTSKLSGDASIAIISAAALAVGVMVISINGVNVDINSYLFGSILATSSADVVLSGIITLMVLLIFILFYPRIFAVTFDERFAKTTGTKTIIYELIFTIIYSVVIVIGMKLSGALLISSLIVFPVSTARNIVKSFKTTLIFSVIISVVNFIVGFLFACLFSLPTGATIVIISLFNFLLFKFISMLK